MDLCFDRSDYDLKKLEDAEGRIVECGDVALANPKDRNFVTVGEAGIILDQNGNEIEMTDGLLSAGVICVRGAYNAADLNRVGIAVAALTRRLEAHGCTVPTSPKSNWTEGDIQTPAAIAAYLADVRAMRGALATMLQTPQVPGNFNSGVTMGQANDIERILGNLELVLDAMEAAPSYSGDIFSGEAF